MENFKSISEILSNKGNKEELYVSDQKKRKWRSNKGLYTKNKGTFDFIHLIKQWDQIVGKMMADNTIPLKIYKSSLIISAKHPIFAQELGFLAPMIIEKIHASFPELKSKVSKIKFSNSKNSSSQFLKQNKTFKPQKETKQKLHPYSPEYQALKLKANKLFEEIEDNEVKEMLTNFLISG